MPFDVVVVQDVLFSASSPSWRRSAILTSGCQFVRLFLLRSSFFSCLIFFFFVFWLQSRGGVAS